MNFNNEDDFSSDDSESLGSKKARKPRTPSRTKVLQEVLSVIDTDISELAEEMAEGGMSQTTRTKLEALQDFRKKLEEIASSTPKKPSNGRWYIGVGAGGKRTAFQVMKGTPTKEVYGDGTEANFISVLGPCLTKDGALYRCEHPEVEVPTVF